MNKRQERLRFIDPNLASAAGQSGSWINRELGDCQFRDVRIGKRFRKLLQQLSDGIGGSIPWACQDWANTKAADRFFANAAVREALILIGHFSGHAGAFCRQPRTGVDSA